MSLYQELYQLKELCQVEEQKTVHELIYFVFEDLQNVFGIYVETNASLEHFKYSQTHQYAELARKRLIVQINISCGIMHGLSKTYDQNTKMGQYFKKLKSLSKLYIEEMMLQIKPFDEQIQYLMNHYMYQILLTEQHESLNMLPFPKFAEQKEFNQDVLDNIFKCMQNVDKDLLEIKEGKVKLIPEQNTMFDKAVNRYHKASEQLRKNFPFEIEKQKQIEAARKYGFI